MVEFEKVDVKGIDKYLKEIDKCFGQLYKSVSIEKQKDLEYNIYYLSNVISELKKIYIRNLSKLNTAKDREFLEQRKNFNSDLTTTKKINKDFIQENNVIQIQEEVMERLKGKEKTITRLADFINNERINELSLLKRAGV